MNVLAFDTCFYACSVAVSFHPGGHGGGRAAPEEPVRVAARELMQTGHAESLLPMIAAVMAKAGMSFPDIEGIAVTTGPGTFTGTRISVATARGLSLATGAPIAAFSALRLIAEGARQRLSGRLAASDAVLVAREARRGEVYVEAVSAAGAPLTGPLLLTPEAAAALCRDRRLLAFGSGAEAVAAAAADAGRVDARAVIALDAATAAGLDEPDASFLLGLSDGVEFLAAAPAPLYLRPPDAKPQAGPAIARI